MMKNNFTRLFMLAVLLMTGNALFAQIVKTNNPTSITLLSDDGVKSTILFHAGNMIQMQVNTPLGNATVISVDEGTAILKTGAPDLPKLTASVIIPDDLDMQVSVVSSSFTDYENVFIAPSKGTLTRDINPSSVPYTYSAIYNENEFFPGKLAELRDPYILRDFRGQTIVIYPFQYNPVTHVLRYYHNMEVEVTPSGNVATNILTRSEPFTKVVNEFDQVYLNHFLNYSAQKGERYNPLEEEGEMLVISYGQYMDEMQPFVDWKKQRGIRTEMVDVATVGNTASAISTYIANYYNTHDLAFVVLAGDDPQVTSSTTGAGDSDNEFGYLAGNDHYQEIFVGRISAQTEADVTNQVNKIIAYEKTPIVNDYYAKGVGIASDQGPGDDGEMDYEHEQNIRSVLLNYTYTDIYELYDGSQGGLDEPGDPNSSDLSVLVNDGLGVVNYTGHGSTTSIATTGFDNSDADNLTNTTEWPFVWIVGCVTGNFTSNTCFGEAWARSTNSGQPAGSVSNFMSTINQYWDEPMEGQDEMNFLLADALTNNIKRTYGGICINGCFSMNDEYGGSGEDMTDTWVIFGDPSLTVRTALPTTLTVSHNPSMFIGTTQFQVSSLTEDATVCLTIDGEILQVGKIQGGNVLLSFPAVSSPDTMVVTVTAFNKIPYVGLVPIVPATGPYVISNSVTVIDITGNNNGLADYNESITLNSLLENVGILTANVVSATIATTDPYITITDATQSYGNINAGATASQNDAFAFTVAGNVPDQHIANFSCTITDNASGNWVSSFSIVLNAPAIGATDFDVSDAAGNNDGYLDPDEAAIINIDNSNLGHATAINSVGVLTSNNPNVAIGTASFNVGDILVGSTPIASFNIYVYPGAPYGEDVDFTYTVAAGAYTGVYNFTTTITPAIEDWETNTTTAFAWTLSGDADWFTTSQLPFEGSYCSESGNISDNDQSILTIALDVQMTDDISFMYKVSSEAGWDFMNFYIDNVLKNEWSGIVDWTAASYPVTTGQHTFKWVYDKDGYLSAGEDCAWLDNIMLPAFEINPHTGIEATDFEQSINVHPNPFSSLSFIAYELTEAATVTILVYNTSGQMVCELLAPEQQSAGNYQFGFDGSKFSNGTYFVCLTIGGETHIKKLVLNKQ